MLQENDRKTPDFLCEKADFIEIPALMSDFYPVKVNPFASKWKDVELAGHICGFIRKYY